jgi:LuxR family quorum sensing-dependent transcriptional regulator
MLLDPKAWNFIKTIEYAEDENSVVQLLLKRAAVSGFQWAFAGRVPTAATQARDIHSHVLFQELPRKWAARYNRHNYALRDPVVRHLHRSTAPFTWEESYVAEKQHGHAELISGEAAAFGLKKGYVIPIRLVGGVLAAVSFGASQMDLDPNIVAQLAFAANLAVGHLLRLRYDLRDKEYSVSPRERECLLWASEGKTDWEISVILGISRPTVTKHLLSARQRLGAVNRAHLIGAAIRHKIIR